MGTHNLLLGLGRSSYLEVIAIDPQAAAPQRPRWFHLDQLSSESLPSLRGWVACTTRIQTASDRVSHALGDIELMSRDALEWQITVPRDGSIPYSGVAPLLIQWLSPFHPADRLEDQGCRLVGLEGIHPDAEAIAAMMRAIGFTGDFVVSMPQPGEAAGLVAHIKTPGGMRRLTSIGVSCG